MVTLETDEQRHRMNCAARNGCSTALRMTGGEVPVGSCRRCGAFSCTEKDQLRGPRVGTPEWAVEQAGELNRIGKHRDYWFYYPTYHDTNHLWFVMRRKKYADITTAVYITGELSGRELIAR
jgi:hypothetical protein